jgi:hypothetical protein
MNSASPHPDRQGDADEGMPISTGIMCVVSAYTGEHAPDEVSLIGVGQSGETTSATLFRIATKWGVRRRIVRYHETTSATWKCLHC